MCLPQGRRSGGRGDGGKGKGHGKTSGVEAGHLCILLYSIKIEPNHIILYYVMLCYVVFYDIMIWQDPVGSRPGRAPASARRARGSPERLADGRPDSFKGGPR